jgi:hypothetical protein
VAETIAEPVAVEAEPPKSLGRLLLNVLWPEALVLLLFLALATRVFPGAWASPRSVTIGGGGGDAGLFIWFLRWTPYAVGHGLNPLFSDHLNYPHGVNAMWNTSLPLPGLLLAPVTSTLGVIFTFNLLLTAALGLSAFSAYLAIRRYVPSDVAAAVGGLVFGFSAYILNQSRGHLHVTLLFLVPPMLVALEEILVRQRGSPWWLGAGLGFLAACQLLIGEEVLVGTALIGGIMLVVLVLLYPRQVASRVPYALRALATAAFVWLILVAWPLWLQLAGPQHIVGNIQRPINYVSDLYNFVVPTRSQWLASPSARRLAAHFTGNIAEQGAYLGIPLLLIGVVTAILWWSKPVVRVSALLGLAAAVLSMGGRLHVAGRTTGVHLPWRAFQNLPLISNLIPARLVLFTTLFVGLLLAWFVWRAWSWGVIGRALAVVVVVAALVPLVPSGVRGTQPVRTPAFFTGSEVRQLPEGSVALVVPPSAPLNSYAMVWQAQAGMRFKMLRGYFAGPHSDPSAPAFGAPPTPLSNVLFNVQGGQPPKLTNELRASLRDELRVDRVQTVIVGPMRRQQTMVRFLTDLLGREPSPAAGGVYLWRDALVSWSPHRA